MTTQEVVHVMLPTEPDVGSFGEWDLPSDDECVHLVGRFLGISSSQQFRHHHDGDRPEFDERCRACRWFEPRIFRESAGGRRYLIHRTGRSMIPGEVSLTSHEWVRGPHGVIESLTTRRRNPRTGTKEPYLTQPAARVLAMAADFDDDLERAYVDRAVA